MRAGNLMVVVLGLAAVAFAVAATARWGRLPTRSTRIDVAADGPARNPAFATAGWSLASVLSAGAVAGLVVGGLVGRLVMRIGAAVSSPDVQGRLTEADETIGEVTFGGTVALLVFVGLLGGIVASGLYLVARPWLPATARASGLVIGVVVLGALGPGDPLDPGNVDFALLDRDGLLVALIVGGSVLFGLAFAALAARFDVLVRSGSPWRWLLLASYVLVLTPPVGLTVLLYLLGRTFAPDRLRPVLERRPVLIAGRAMVCLAVAWSLVRLVAVASDIVRA